MAPLQMEPGGNIWTISLASGMGTAADENAAHCQLQTGPTALPVPEAILTPTG